MAEKITDAELQSIVARAITDGKNADDDLSEVRKQALEYYQGDVTRKIKIVKNSKRSKAVSNDVLEYVTNVMPSLVGIFTGSDKAVNYTATDGKGAASVEPAERLINHEFHSRLDGYRIFHDVCLDALLAPAAIIKVWWDKQPHTEIDYLDRIGIEQVQVMEAAGVEILQQTDHADGTSDIKFKRTINPDGKLCVETVAPEDFLITPNERFKAHRCIYTRSELIEMGFDADKVNRLPEYGKADEDDEDEKRDIDNYQDESEAFDKSMEEIEIFECYLSVDIDKDGIAEPIQVYACHAGDDKCHILSWDIWQDQQIFHTALGLPMSHRWHGRTPVEVLFEIMEQKTVVKRQVFDNIYDQNNRKRFVSADAIIDPSELNDNRPGGFVRIKSGRNPRDVVYESAPVFIGDAGVNMLAYLDDEKGKRTGVDRRAMGNSPDVLQNQTAEAVATQKDAAHQGINFIARNLANTGLKTAFEAMLRLVVKYQRQPVEVPVGERWEAIDPTMLTPRLNAKVNIGLGTGSRERDLAALSAIASEQKQMIGQMGPTNPVCNLTHLSRTLSQMVDAAGLGNGEGQYFREIGQDDLQRLAEQNKGKPNPEQQKMQAEMQMKQAEMAMRQSEAAANLELKREQMRLDHELKKRQVAEEMQLKREIALVEAHNKINLATQVDVGGVPG